MSHEAIDNIKFISTSLLFTGGSIAISLQDVEDYLRITSLLVGTATTLLVFLKNYKKK